MPRKAKLIKKDEGKIIQEKPKLSQEEVNSLEQVIEEDESKISTSELREFLREQNIEITPSSPSLKKVNPPQRNQIMLERDIITGAMSIENTNRENENQDEFKYIPENKRTNEPKYIKYMGTIAESIIPRREFEELSIKTLFEKKEAKFESSMQSRTPEQTTFEKYSPVGRLDKEKKIAKNPFDRKEIKYTPEKY